MRGRTSVRPSILGTVVYVADLASAIRFYRDALGLSLVSETSEQAALAGKEGRIVLSRRWWPPTLVGVHPFTPTACLSTGEVASAIQVLEERGARVLMRPTPFPDGSTIAEVLDPDGNVVRLVGRAKVAKGGKARATRRKGRR